MTFRVTCPACETSFKCDESKEGERVSCPSCDERFVAEGTDTRVRTTSARPIAVPKVRSIQDEDDLNESPRPSKAKPAKKSSGGGLVLVLGGLAVVALVGLVVIGGGIAFFLLARNREPAANVAANNDARPDPPPQPVVIAKEDAKPPAQKFNLEEARKSVVFLRVFTPGMPPSTGSGFFVTTDGLIATNRHVLESDDGIAAGAKIIVGVPRPNDADTFDYYHAEHAFTPPRNDPTDFALVKIKAAPNGAPFRALPLIAKDTVPLGTEVAALGYPFASEDKVNVTFTKGSISSTKVAFDNKSFYQTDAAVNPGNSGGPLLNTNGEVVGIVTLRRNNAENTGYALYLSETNLRNLPVENFAALKPTAGPLAPDARPTVRTVAAKRENWKVERGNAKEIKNAVVLHGDTEASSFWVTNNGNLPENFQLSFVTVIVTPDAADKVGKGMPIGPGMIPRPGFPKGPKKGPIGPPVFIGGGAPALLAIRFTNTATNNDIIAGDGLTFLQSTQNVQARANRQPAGQAMGAAADGIFVVSVMKSGNTVVYYVNGKEHLRTTLPANAQGNLRISVGGVRGAVLLTDLYVEQYGGPVALVAPPVNPPIEVKPPPVNPPPVAPGLAFVANTNKRDIDGLIVHDLYEGANDVLSCMMWSRDAKHAYLLEKGGTLHKVSITEPKAVAKVQLPQSPVSWLADSAEGLLVAVPKSAVLIVDPETLQVKKTIPFAVNDRFASHPASSLIYVNTGVNNLAVIDLKTGNLVKQHGARDFNTGFCFGHPLISPDGKFLFGEGMLHLHRFALNGAELKLEQTGPRMGGREFFMSGDGKFVLVAGNGAEVLVYPHDNLTTPAFSLKAAGILKAPSPGKNAERIFAWHGFKQFAIINRAGTATRAIALPSTPPWTRQVLVAPEETRALVLVGDRVFLLDNIPPGPANPPVGQKPPS